MSLPVEIEFILSQLRGTIESVSIELSKVSPDWRVLESSLQRSLMLLSRLREYLRIYTESFESVSFLRFVRGAQELSTKQQRGTQVSFDELFDVLSSLRIPRVPERDIEHVSSVIELTLTVMNYAADKVSPEYLKEKTRNVLKDLHTLLARIEADYKSKPPPLALVFELTGITKDRLGFGERWVVATCYLSALDIALNNAFKTLQLEGEVEKLSFKDKVTQLLKALEKRGIDVSFLLRKLPDDLWDLRNRIVHAGYEPNDGELSIITGAVKELLSLLVRLEK